MNRMLSLDEIGLIPSKEPTNITSRSNVNPYTDDSYIPYRQEHEEKEFFPVFVSPMTSVVNKENMQEFKNEGFIPILPRNYSFEERIELCQTDWVAFSLQEFVQIYEEKIPLTKEHMYILIDIANGHIDKLYTYSRKLKERYQNITLMVGNIAHPNMYWSCCINHIDYVRVGIGGGSVCTTSVQTGIHASLVWMIEEINKIKYERKPSFETKVIADGGINTIDRMIKCLALGYDYVMVGKLFAKSDSACGKQRVKITTTSNDVIYLYEDTKVDFLQLLTEMTGDIKNFCCERMYYGMASEEGQNAISGGICKNPEGISTWIPVEYKLKDFRKKFEASLRSTMSYIGANDLHELKIKTTYLPMSQTEFNAYYK
jgi:IMP dehydrogenase/GMP reductase